LAKREKLFFKGRLLSEEDFLNDFQWLSHTSRYGTLSKSDRECFSLKIVPGEFCSKHSMNKKKEITEREEKKTFYG
jgi:hypothetical protein